MHHSHKLLHRRLVGLLIACGLLISQSVALAGADAVKLVVKDPQSGVEFEVTEPALLGFMVFADLTQPLPTAPTVGDGYEITRYWDTGPFDHFHYYPGTGNSPGYLYYDGFLQGWSPSDGKWYRTHDEADHAMQQLLTAHGLPLPSTARPVPVAIPAVLGISVAVIVLAAMGLRRGWH